MRTKIVFVTLAIFSVFIVSMSKTCPQRFKCSALDVGKCTKESTQPDSTLLYELQSCNATSTCNWGTADVDTNPIVSCTANTNTPNPSYPGGKCDAKTTCFGGATCTNNTCVGKAANTTCATHNECNAGLSCFNDGTAKTCRPQANTAGACFDDYDCINTHGCNDDKTCVAYFSAKDGSKVKYLPGDLSLCESGEATTDGICVRNTNEGTAPFACSDANPCQYKNNGTVSTDAKACACSKGPSGNTFCPLGNGMDLYQAYVTEQKKYLALTATGKCHTLERTNCPSLSDKNAYTLVYSKSIDAKYNHTFVDADSCVKKTIYPNILGPNPPAPPACPKVTCGKLDGGKCADFSINTDSSKKFTGQTCSDKAQSCDGLSSTIFTQQTNTTLTCKTPAVTPTENRFPGEKCDTNNGCIFGSKKCNNTCDGAAANTTCAAHTDCNLGLFCNTTDAAPKCVKQLGNGAACKFDEACPNGQGCLNEKCTDYYSLALGSDVSKAAASVFSPTRFCISNNVMNGKCYHARNNYNNMTANKDGLVKCSLGQSCNYTDSEKTPYTEDCQCSYDKDGQSFCRKNYNEDNNWKKIASAQRSQVAQTTCHTSHRFACFDTPKDFKTSMYDASLVTDRAAQLFYAEDCIKKLFAAGEYIKFSFFVVAALLINLI
jgi:hypothetical protein